MTMRPWTDQDLVEVWTETRHGTPADQVDALLERTAGQSPRDWPLARRHRDLLAARVRRWGRQLEAIADCPGCAGEIELSVDVSHLIGEVSEPEGEHSLDTPTARISFRLPTSDDVEAVRHLADPGVRRRTFVERCMTSAPDDSAPLSDENVAALIDAMADADPVGTVTFELCCPDCSCLWTEPLDLVAFVARQVAEEARRMLAEVHVLASAYGWSEGEILALPTRRRGLYVELVNV
jgi:hypothetical protein